MPDYDFRSLSPVDFEHLTRDILNADLKLDLQSYAAGRDQGIDLRQVRPDGTIIVGQCKHYLESSWDTFLRAVRKEAAKGQALHADRYLFVTSRPLTPLQQDKVVEALAPVAVEYDDVWGRDVLNAALGRCPDVERRHIKLWLWSTEMLDSVVNAGRWNRSDATLEDVRDQAKLWVHTAAYDEVRNVLGREGVCIVIGPPGVGKTFLAEMTLLSAVTSNGWEAVHLSGDIEDGWDALKNSTRQFFYFNDFLGETEFAVASRNEPTNLERFIRHIRRHRQHKRFLMTTREQTLGVAAASAYDALQRINADVNRIGVRMGEYSTYARAEILFNHIYFSGIQESERARLAVDNRIISIVEHPAYNPRLIQLGIEKAHDQTAEQILETIRWSLDRPQEVWETSFLALSAAGQQTLLSLATLPSRPCPIDTVRLLAGSTGALDWRMTLRVLEPTWVRITGSPAEKYIGLANPSCRDYLLGVLDDPVFAEEQVARIRLLDQIVSLSRSAGLMAGNPSSVQRPALAHVLMSGRDRLVDNIQGFAGIDLSSPDRSIRSHVKVLINAAGLLAALDAESPVDWLLDRIDHLISEFDTGAVPGAAELFSLATQLAALSIDAEARRDALTEQLVMVGISASKTIHDLDTYEDLPENLRTATTREPVRRFAAVILAAALEDVTQSADDAETVRAAAADLEQRARWYGLEVDIGPLLDLAADLAAREAADAPREEHPAPAVSSRDDPGASIAELFSHLRD